MASRGSPSAAPASIRAGFTHALIVRLRDEEALGRYLDHPLRAGYIADHLQPLEAERIEISVPVDKSLLRDPSRGWEWGASVGMGPPLEF
jgi:Stress responsive A/B Barrel Domain